MALVPPMLADGRLVAQPELGLKIGGYAYWLVEAAPRPRAEVAPFRDWMLAQVEQAVGMVERGSDRVAWSPTATPGLVDTEAARASTAA
jgi:hypothetical protein